MTNQLIIATHNRDKLREFQILLPQFAIRGAFEFGLSEPVEDGETFADNARIKAEFFYKNTNIPCIADDSGLVIDDLAGMPGVYSARWANTKDFTIAMQKLQVMLAGIHNPTGHFICALCYVGNNNTTILAEGRTDGTIIFPPRGQLGFGYDPVFVPNGETRSFGEISIAEKNKYSHRQRALDVLQAKLR